MKNGAAPAYVPEEIWKDDDRMMGFMSMFKKREVNPADYDGKLKFWVQAVERYSEHGKDPVVHLRALQCAFQRGDRVPAGLNTVLREMLGSGQLQTEAEFMSSADGWVSWGVRTFVKSPLYWLAGWQQEADDTSGQQLTHNLICINTVKSLANQLMERHESWNEENMDNSGHVVDFQTLKRRTKDIFANEKALTLALVYLQKEHVLTIDTGAHGEKIVKFRDTSTSKGPVTITDIDRNIFNMKRALQKLEVELDSLEAKQKQLDAEVRKLIRDKQKTRAMQVLRQKKLVEKKLQDKDTIYTNLFNLLNKLSDTDDQKEVLSAYQSGVAAFKSNLAKHGLTADQIDTTMDDIQDAMSDYNEISSALASPSNFGLAADEPVMDELEAELSELLDEEKTKRKRPAAKDQPPSKLPVPSYPAVPRGDAVLPDVPSHSPSKLARTGSGNGVQLDRLKQLRRELESA